jgi:hypothetical protein
MSGLIGDRTKKSALDEMEEVARARNKDVAEEEKLEIIAAERRAKERTEKAKVILAQPEDIDAIVCKKRIPMQEYEALRSIYSEVGLDIGKAYRYDRFSIRDRKVVKICLNGYDLTKVPEEVGNLSHMEWLVLFDNKLKALPGFIANL